MQTDRDLVEAVRSGNRTAFAELVRRYERVALSTAWNVLRDHHLSQDATQNAFVEAFRQFTQLRSAEHFGAWVIHITRREALKIAAAAHRTIALRTEIERDYIASDPLTDHWADLLAAVGRLPEQERIVVGLRYFEGNSVADIARATGQPSGTVTKQLSRAIKRLKSTFARSSSNHDARKP